MSTWLSWQPQHCLCGSPLEQSYNHEWFWPLLLIFSRLRDGIQLKSYYQTHYVVCLEESQQVVPPWEAYLASSEFLSRQMEVWAVFFLSPVDSPLTDSGLMDSTGGPTLTMRPDCAHLVAFRRAAEASSVITSQQPPWVRVEDSTLFISFFLTYVLSDLFPSPYTTWNISQDRHFHKLGIL